MDQPVTELLNRAGSGDEGAVQAVYPIIAAELRRIAERQLRSEPEGHSLQATVLVNDAFLSLVDRADLRWQGRAHFFAVASAAIRRLLIDHARREGRQKRGGGWRRVELHDGFAAPSDRQEADLLELDEALTRLAALHERQARIVELRFFGGLSVQEAADLLGVSPRTVEGDWATARAWLRRELRRGGS